MSFSLEIKRLSLAIMTPTTARGGREIGRGIFFFHDAFLKGPEGQVFSEE